MEGSTPFTPIDGEMSRRQRIYEQIRSEPTDVLIPYESLPYDLTIIHGLREEVAKTMEREQNRSIVSIPGKGWKIVQGTAQVVQATRKRKQATKKLGRAVQLIESVDRNDMSAEEQVRADKELISAVTGYGVLRGLATKHTSLEDIKKWEKENRK